MVNMDNKKQNVFLTIVYPILFFASVIQGTHCLQFWAQLQWYEYEQAIIWGASRTLETMPISLLRPMDGLLHLESGLELVFI